MEFFVYLFCFTALGPDFFTTGVQNLIWAPICQKSRPHNCKAKNIGSDFQKRILKLLQQAKKFEKTESLDLSFLFQIYKPYIFLQPIPEFILGPHLSKTQSTKLQNKKDRSGISKKKKGTQTFETQCNDFSLKGRMSILEKLKRES